MQKLGLRLLIVFVSCVLLLGCAKNEETVDAPTPVKDSEEVDDIENRAPEVTLDFLREAIAVTKVRAESGVEPLEPVVSNSTFPIAQPKPIDNPPIGAAHHEEPREQDIRLEETGAVPLKRDRPKAASEESDPPPPPPDWRRIGFSSGVLELRPGIDERLLNASEQITDRNFTFAFLVLDEYLTDPVERKLESAGVEILGPHASAYKATVPVDPERLKRIASLPFVYWIGYPDPELKLERAFSEAREKYGSELKALPVLINLFDEFDQKTASRYGEELRRREIILGPYDSDIGAFEAVVPLDQVPWLINSDFILFIELQTPGAPAHDESAAVMGADYIRTGGSGMNFSGSSTLVGILDTGFMLGSAAATMHNDLNKHGCGKNFTSDAAGVWNDEKGHGTHMIATIGGTGTADSRYRGMATGIGNSVSTPIRAAKIWRKDGHGQPSWYLDGMNYLAESSSCNSGPPLVINLSGGRNVDNPNGTDARSRKLDAKSFDDKQAYIVAAGNKGPNAQTVLTPAAAKNAITVGNVQKTGFQNIGDIYFESSRGPTADSRMKPNVVATGRSIRSALAGTSNDYETRTGSSEAAAHVAGIAATLLDHYDWLRWRPYLLRAHLMATAILHDDDTTPRNNSSGGRNTYGLGRVSSYVSHWSRPNSNGWNTYLSWRTITNSSWGFRDIQVPVGADRLVVVMTWDEDSASTSAEAVDYDLDLWIDRNADCSPDSKGQCGEWASQSYVDNVEYLIVDSPPAGTYRLKIVNWHAPSSGLPVGLVATVIRGDPTPSMSLSASASDLTPNIGDTVTITTTVSNPAYVASGVYLEWQNQPAGLSIQGVSTTRKDGVTINFTGSSFSLGNIVQGDTRSAAWSFRVNSTSSKTINFRAWSENGGTVTTSITINPVP